MSELTKICKAIIQARDYQADTNRKRVLYRKVFNVEKRLFDIYLRSGKSRRDNFPFESLGSIIFMNQEEISKVAKSLFDAGWKPEVHVTLVRERFKNITFIGSTLTF